MKNIKLCFKIFLLLVLLSSCQKSSILDKAPLDKYTDAVLWKDINLVNAYLLGAYEGTGIGFYQSYMTGLTDETYCFQGSDTYVKGQLTPDNPYPTDGLFWSDYFQNIQKINVFLSKIDKVADAYPETQKAEKIKEANVMKGEALFLRAYSYARLALAYGGVPIFKVPGKLGDDFVSIPRNTFDETIKFISDDCDAAAALLLSNENMKMGRATKGAALALKSKILLFAARDLTADGTAKNKYVGYESPNRNALWTAARDAAKAVIDLGTYQLADFGAPDKVAVAQNYFNFFKAKDLSNSEIIWGKMYSRTAGDGNRMNLWNNSNGLNCWGGNNPTQQLVDDYQMEDGSDFFNHFNVDGNGYYKNISSKYHNNNPYYSRDPRFYGSILYDSAVWQNRFPNLIARDPVGIYDRRTRIVSEGGTVISTLPGIDTRQSIYSDWNGGYTGYLMKKMLDDEFWAIEQTNEWQDNVWIEFRYAEIILNYAEACLQLGQISEAATYINMIRNRAALPDFTGDITKALRYERKIELAFESCRWYDIRGWKILEQTLTDAMGMEIIETKNNGLVTTTWQRIVAQERGPVIKDMYWLPIPTDEIKKAPKLEQNPEY